MAGEEGCPHSGVRSAPLAGEVLATWVTPEMWVMGCWEDWEHLHSIGVDPHAWGNHGTETPFWGELEVDRSVAF